MEEETNQNQEQNTPDTPQHHKWLWPLVVVLVLVATGVSAWAVYNKQIRKDTESTVEVFDSGKEIDEFANWQTYRSEEYGFILSYPDNWEENQSVSGGGEFKLIAYFEAGSSGLAGDEMRISITNDPVDTVKEDREANQMIIYSKISVSGKEAYISDVAQGFEGGVQEVLIDSPQGTLLISAGGKAISDFDQIFSTFKFIDSESTQQLPTLTPEPPPVAPRVSQEEILNVAAHYGVCVSEITQKCLVVVDDNDFYDPYSPIEGFEYEEGYTYVIRVKKENAFEGEVPADANPYKYTLIELISKIKSE